MNFLILLEPGFAKQAQSLSQPGTNVQRSQIFQMAGSLPILLPRSFLVDIRVAAEQSESVFVWAQLAVVGSPQEFLDSL